MFSMEDYILNQFCIGEEFALLEFKVEFIETITDKKGIDYDYYEFNEKLPNEKINKIILAYNCDILRGIFVTLRS